MIHMTLDRVTSTQSSVLQTIHCDVGLKCFFPFYQNGRECGGVSSDCVLVEMSATRPEPPKTRIFLLWPHVGGIEC